jgi:hypothetical protein
MTEHRATIISDPGRTPVVAERNRDCPGGVALRGAFKSVVVLSPTEIQCIVDFASDAPKLGELQRYVVPKTAPESPQAGDLTPSG